MDWYIDNTPAGPGNDANNGHTPATAKLTVNGVNSAVDFTALNSPHNIYIKASGTVYTTINNASILWAIGVTNITVDRYPTDTGTSRPVISKSYSTTDSRIWGVRGNTNFTIRNIHFIGKNDGNDSVSYGMIYAPNATTGLIIEYCVFEQSYSYYAIKSHLGDLVNLTVRYCHFYLNIAKHESTVVGAIGRSGGNDICGANISYCLFENYVYPIDIYRNASAGETFLIHHNTFVNCGRTANGKIIKMDALFALDILTIRDNIVVGNDSVGSVGFYKIAGAVTYTADYNDWYGIATSYFGTPLPTSLNDIDLDPLWQGGAEEWVDAHIDLAVYYAPAGTNYPVVLGDSVGSCMGAIYILAHMPPPTISPLGGDYSSSLTISISSAISGTTIRYTVDGSVPDLSSLVYSLPFNLPTSAVVRAGSWKTGYAPSSITSETYVINHIPSSPIPVTINVPTIPALGGLPCANNTLFKRLKSGLVDDNIYDTSEAAIGITNYTVSFVGNIGDESVTSLTIYRNYRDETKIVAVVVPDANGNYVFYDKLPHGRAFYYAISSDGVYHSNTIHLNSYNIHVWLCAYASELLVLRRQTAQTRQDGKIEDGTDLEGDAITTDGDHLTRNFGEYISARKLETMTRAEYQRMLLDVLAAYDLGPSLEALDLICRVFTQEIPSITWYKDVHGFPTLSPRVRVLNPPGLDYEWDETWMYFYDRWNYVPAGSGTVLADDLTYLWVDGTTNPLTCENRMEVLASGVHPFRYEMNFAETLIDGLVKVDADGTNTGVSGELYATLSRFPLELLAASGSLSPYTNGITSAFLVPHTSNLDLGIAQDNVDKTLVFGNVTVNYTTNYEYRILAVIGSDSSAITGIGECGRIDGSGAVSRDVQVHHQAGILEINGSQVLTDEAKSDLFDTLRDVKPSQKKFYIFFENAISGELEYYGTI